MATGSKTPGDRRLLKYEGIQALRFVAALMVVVMHSMLYTRERLDGSFGVWAYGTVGVDIFFCISGFVMVLSTSRIAGQDSAWREFALRRLIRIVPMYWLATTIKLAIMLLASGAVLHAAFAPDKTILSYLFLPSRNVDGNVEPLLGVGWTLIYEMFFYTVFAIGLWLRANLYIFCGAILSACALGTLARGDDWPPALVYLDAIVLYFLVGMILAAWVTSRRTGLTVAALAYVAALWTLIDVFNNQDGGLFAPDRLPRELLVTALVAAVVLAEPVISGRVPKPLLYMGDASYTLYLFHPLMAPLVPAVLYKIGLVNGYVSLALAVVGVIIASALIYRFVERPMTVALQRRLLKSPRHPQGASIQAGDDNRKDASDSGDREQVAQPDAGER